MKKYGNISVICGPMFSGKTSELLRRVDRLKHRNKNVLLFKPKFDDRYSDDEIVSHNNYKIKSFPVDNARDIKKILQKEEYQKIRHIAIDETQFFSKNDKYTIYDLLLELKIQKYSITVNGLDMDNNGKPFGLMPDILAIADDVLKLKAVCKYPGCEEDAGMSYKMKRNKIVEDNQVELGEQDIYQARCFHHWLLDK